MCDAIVHRGPDDSGVHIDGPLGMGMRRLSIIDLATGRQPIANEDGTVWIVFNGEIYNHDELRQELLAAGHRFRTSSDTEVVLHLYEDLGPAALNRLRGMFGIAIWDTRDRSLFLARDRLGIKPLFWGQAGGRLVFGSEMKSLLTVPEVSQDIDWNGLDAYFTYNYIPAPLTIYRAIRKLLPGHYLMVRDGRIAPAQVLGPGVRRQVDRQRREDPGRVPGTDVGFSPPAADERGSPGRVPVGRRGLGVGGCADEPQLDRCGQYLHHRLRRRDRDLPGRAALRARDRRALRLPPSGDRGAAADRRRARCQHRRVRRAVRR